VFEFLVRFCVERPWIVTAYHFQSGLRTQTYFEAKVHRTACCPMKQIGLEAEILRMSRPDRTEAT
jgi:hypothetical protein